ncbi:MAG TPA: hypothetical protein VGN01_20965 [Acidobacteriaceae bacterium]|jgi:hypothetical protein
MIDLEVEDGVTVGLTAEMIRAQLDLLVHDEAFRSSKRSVAFLRYVVEQTLNGSASQIKERTIGVEVFGREPTYDTNLDHIVRTAATELRKRLAIYYGDEKHRSELRMGLIPGSYIPRFGLAPHPANGGDLHATIPEPLVVQPKAGMEHLDISLEPPPEPAVAQLSGRRRSRALWIAAACIVALATTGAGYSWLHRPTAEDLFWKPVMDTQGPVLLAIGDVPNGPPMPAEGDSDSTTPILAPSPNPQHTVPFADAVTMARVVGILESGGKSVVIRNENSRTFSDLREGPVVLIGAFNNEWSLRLTRALRYSLALDADRHLIYIRDSKNPTDRSWNWATNQSRENVGQVHGPPLQDFALISRIRNSQTGHVVVVIGGLYTYGTQSAGEFLTDPRMMQAISRAAELDPAHPNLQIVLGTTVTDQTPGPPKVLAVSTE